jgi:hypothetical protein
VGARPARPATRSTQSRSAAQAREELIAAAGKQLDARVVGALLDELDEDEA